VAERATPAVISKIMDARKRVEAQARIAAELPAPATTKTGVSETSQFQHPYQFLLTLILV